MGLFKSAAQKAAERERRADMEAAEAARHAVGLALAAHRRGDAIFQMQFEVGRRAGGVLSQVEAIGWSLDRAGYVYTFAIDSDSHYVNFSDDHCGDVLQSVSSYGEIMGIYLFRNRGTKTVVPDAVASPGWYPNPDGSAHTLRYWSGTEWTASVVRSAT